MEDDENPPLSENEYNTPIAITSKCRTFRHYSDTKCSLECCARYMKSSERVYHPPSVLSTVHYYGFEDPSLHLVKQKQEYIFKLDTIKKAYNMACSTFDLKKQYSCYYDLNQYMDTDPDPYFHSNYNWYYTGGSIEILKIAPQDFVFHVSNENGISASLVKPKASEWEATTMDVPIKTNSTIFQLDSAQLNPLVLAARCRNNITLFAISMNNGEFQAEKLYKNIDLVPFTNFCINKAIDRGHNYATINTSHVIKLWDLDKFQLLLTLDQNKDIVERDRFAQVVLKGNYLYYINRTSMHIFDTRSPTSVMNLNHTSLIESNDRFTSICTGQNENELFVTSFKNIQVLDWRLKSAIYSWSHYFSSAPYVSDVINLGEKNNIIAASSHVSREKSFCEYNGNICYLSYNPHSLIHTFDRIKCLEEGFTMERIIRRRLELSTTGLKFFKKDNRLALLFSNTIGDLFYHDIQENSKEPVVYKTKISDFLNWNQCTFEACITDEYCNKLTRVDRVMFSKDLPSNHKPPKEEPPPKNRKLEKCLEFICKSKYGYFDRITEPWQHVNSTLDGFAENQRPTTETVNEWLNKCNDVPNSQQSS